MRFMRPPETRYVTVGDADVAYQVVGDGPIDLLFHHGMCHVDLQWDLAPEAAFLRALASFSRLILFDRRGTGASDRGSSPFLPTWEEWSEDLGAVLDAVGSERTAIFGEVDGAATAILYTATHPDRVSALILGNPSARHTIADDYPIGLPPEVADVWAAAFEAGWGTEELLRPSFPSLGDEDIQSLCKLTRAAATPRAAARQWRHTMADMDVREALSTIHVPTLVFQSDWPPPALAGQAVGLDHARYVAERISGARLIRVRIPDYVYFGGNFEPVIDEVAEFLTGVRPAPAVQRVLTTMLFTDIVESTNAAAAAGDRQWLTTLNAHDAFVREQLRAFRGQEISTTGDGFLAAFDGPGRAIQCARAITSGVGQLGVQVRAGLHTGECELRGTDLAGLAVHIAARVGALARGGEVLVSSTVKDLVAGSGFEFAHRGSQELKGVPGLWNLFEVVG